MGVKSISQESWSTLTGSPGKDEMNK